jgi:drug/metabolite transporter (DMT)-like permease
MHQYAFLGWLVVAAAFFYAAYSVRTDSNHQQKTLVVATWIVAVAYTAMAAWVIHERRETSLRLVMATGAVASIALACYTTFVYNVSKKE